MAISSHGPTRSAPRPNASGAARKSAEIDAQPVPEGARARNGSRPRVSDREDRFDLEPATLRSDEEITAADFGARIKDLLGQHAYKGAKIYYHMDLDGVASAMAMTHFLKRQGVEDFDFEVTQYGGQEFSVSKAEPGWLPVLVDFAHGKPFLAVHSDHHDRQTGATGVRGFVHSASNASFLAGLDPSSPAFDPTDAACVDTIDSARYAGRFTAEQVGSFVTQQEPGCSAERQRELDALVTSKLLLAVKNRKFGSHGALDELLSRLEAMDRPSLADVHAQLLKLLPEVKVDGPAALQEKGEEFFQEAVRLKVEPPALEAIPTMGAGASMQIGNLAVCYGANSKMRYGGYDRYVAFRVFPEAQFQCIAWPMGLVQVSKNPFVKGENPYDFGEFLLGEKGILSHFEAELKATPIDLARIKGVSEVEIRDDDDKAIGFTWSDLEAAYTKEQLRGLPSDPAALERLKEACAKPFGTLTEDERQLLSTVQVSAWDVLKANSGGHDDISQISGLSFLPKDFHGGSGQFARELQVLIATELKDARLAT